MKLLLCFGTRPEAIKMVPIVHQLQKRNIAFRICVTAQHREMLDQVLDFFGIAPHYDLGLMKQDQSLNQLSSEIFKGIDEVFEKEQPNLVLVHGDTTSASMIAQAAFHRQIKIGHVEAGLRTYNKLAPFPEEINRQIISKVADYHFAPTAKAVENLLQEKVSKESIFETGNTIVDALQWGLIKLFDKPLTEEILQIQALLKPNKKMILVTGHRRENLGEGLEEICDALKELSSRKDVEIIYPVHLNPRVKGTVEKSLKKIQNIHLIPPVSYPAMLWLMQRANFIISDSGGIQEEAPAFGKTVIVTRNVTERMEGVETGFSV